jgi:hypothetical protein
VFVRLLRKRSLPVRGSRARAGATGPVMADNTISRQDDHQPMPDAALLNTRVDTLVLAMLDRRVDGHERP